jgi:hypothetical protein
MNTMSIPDKARVHLRHVSDPTQRAACSKKERNQPNACHQDWANQMVWATLLNGFKPLQCNGMKTPVLQ